MTNDSPGAVYPRSNYLLRFPQGLMSTRIARLNKFYGILRRPNKLVRVQKGASLLAHAADNEISRSQRRVPGFETTYSTELAELAELVELEPGFESIIKKYESTEYRGGTYCTPYCRFLSASCTVHTVHPILYIRELQPRAPNLFRELLSKEKDS